MNKLVLASGNQGKLSELSQSFAGLGIEVIAQNQFVQQAAEETGLTFVENAIIKARHACEASGLPALADDSGLEVDALQGQPGIYSSRYASDKSSYLNQDAANNAKLLDALSVVPNNRRTARFQCVLVVMRHALDPVPLICQGSWEGYVLAAPQGDNGFGYDPLFAAADTHQCAAHMSKIEKMQVSHRGQALAKLVHLLPDFLEASIIDPFYDKV